MALLIVSDLHIQDAQDPMYRALLTLLGERAAAGDHLVLAGDIFDLFVGEKRIFQVRYAEFLRLAHEASERGVHLHYIEGNHDFLLPQAFWDAGITVHRERFVLELGGKRFAILHGDLANPHDYSYRVLRAFFRSPVMRALVAIAPGGWLDAFGRASSQYSRSRSEASSGVGAGVGHHRPVAAPHLEELRKVYRNFAAETLAQGCDYVVMGHCHDLDEMSFVVHGRTGQYINVGFPRVHGSFLSWAPGDEKISREPLPG